ncbi:MAG TPA: hypothetical protein VFY32_11020 [Solirubrobacteraceae bacterium]|nr:hypothetical protein [Solirubrobacteraceae bacterium]
MDASEHASIPQEVSLPLGVFAFHELDLLGVSCCSADEFAFEQALEALAHVADGPRS